MLNKRLRLYQNVLRSISSKNTIITNLLTTMNSQIIPYSFSDSCDDEQSLRIRLMNQISHFESFFPNLQEYATTNTIPLSSLFESYWNYVLPYYHHLLSLQSHNKCVIAGVLGVQGAGKTTFSNLIQSIGTKAGKNVIVFSIDDFYLSYQDRLDLKNVDPRFIYRGPPGTHRIDKLFEVFNRITQNQLPIKVPIFDKSLHNGQGDICGENIYDKQPDIVIFEGWFTGLVQTEISMIPPIMNENDRLFAEKCAFNLSKYEKLWELIDSLIILTPKEYTYSRIWRKEAEHKMIAKTGKGMTDQELDLFIDYFWKALHPSIYVEHLLAQNKFDLVVKLQIDHSIFSIQEN